MDDFDHPSLDVSLPPDLWAGFDTDDLATTWRQLEHSELNVFTQKVDFLGRLASEERARGKTNFRERIQAKLELDGDKHARQTIGTFVKIFDVFRVGLGYSRERLAQYPNYRLRAIAQAKNDWATKNRDKVEQLLASGASEADIRLAIAESQAGGDQQIEVRELATITLKLDPSQAEIVKAALEGVVKRETMAGHAFSTYTAVRLGQALYVLVQDWVQADTEIEGVGPVPNFEFMPGGAFGDPLAEVPEEALQEVMA